jgi:hypothetical protein
LKQSIVYYSLFRHFVVIPPSRTGEVLHKFGGEVKDGILKPGHVRCAAVDKSNVYLATSGDDKLLKVWKIDGLQLLSSRYARLTFRVHQRATDGSIAQENYPKSPQTFSSCTMGKQFWCLINLGTSLATLSIRTQTPSRSRNNPNVIR